MDASKKIDSSVKATVVCQVPDYEIKPARTDFDFTNAPFVPFGKDNLFPQASALFARTSPVHRGVINSKRTYLMGGGLQSKNNKLQYLFEKANFEGQNINDIASNYFYDKEAGGNGWIEIITDKKRSYIWFNQLDYTKCRLSRDGKFCLIHPDWARWRSVGEVKQIPIYPEFITERNEYGAFVSRSVFHIKEYEPEFYFYGIPSWLSGKDSILIDLKTNKWNLARLKYAFQTSGIMVVPVKDAGEGKEVIDYVEANFTGEDNQGKLLVLTKSRAQDGEKADQVQLIPTKQEDEGSWEKLHKQSLSDIIIAHSWYRSLTPTADNTGFDTRRILNEYAVAKQTTIQHDQRVFLKFMSKIFREQMNIESDLSFINTPPVTDNSYKRVWEIRRDMGLEYDEADELQKKIIIPQGYTTLQ